MDIAQKQFEKAWRVLPPRLHEMSMMHPVRCSWEGSLWESAVDVSQRFVLYIELLL